MSTNEIMVGPAEVYVAPPGTAFPSVNEDPGAAWHLVGKGGALNYGESGVILRKTMTSNRIGALGTTLTRKRAISESGFQVEFPVMDMSAEELALAYGTDPDDVETEAADASDAGYSHFAIDTSPVPLERAVLVRVRQSATMGRNGNTDWRIARAAYIGTADTTFNKTAAAAVTHIWDAMESGDDEIPSVEYIEQTAAPTG